MKSIYVLEDDRDINELIKLLLTHCGYSVKAFMTVKDLEKLNTQQKPDLYLLDIMLPDGNGAALCKKLKENKETSDIPVILMSAHESIDQVKDANDFLPKPFDIDNLLEKIDLQLI